MLPRGLPRFGYTPDRGKVLSQARHGNVFVFLLEQMPGHES